MLKPLRSLAVLAGAAGAACALEAAEDAARMVAEAEREIAALLAGQPTWSVSGSVEVSSGYRDNVLLSSEGEEASGFTRGAADVLALRFPTGAFEFYGSLRAVRTEFWRREVLDGETQIWGQSELAWRLSDAWRVTLPLTGYYSEQVLDLSTSAAERLLTGPEVTEIRVRGGMVAPTVRWAFLPGWWVEAQARGERKRYEDGLNDGTIGEGVVRLGWIRGERFEAKLAGKRRWRNFTAREQYSADPAGRPLSGTELKISEQELEAACDVAWDAAKRWTTHTRAALLHYRDNGSGYFNYREQRVAQELEWTSEPWLVRVAGTASRLDYGAQLVGRRLNPPARFVDGYSAELHVERKLAERWTVFATYQWERNRSNDPVISYRVNEGLLGVRWDWEK